MYDRKTILRHTMTRLYALTLFLTLNFLPITVYSYNLKQISDKEYMSNSSITSLCQDSLGLMWIGTCDGLNVYDGRQVGEFRSRDTIDYLSGNLIDNMVCTGDACWIQTYYGLNRLDLNTSSITHFNEFQKLFFMAGDRNGNLYVLKDSNCIYYCHRNCNYFRKINLTGLPVSDVLCFFVDSRNLMWVVMKGYSRCFRIMPGASEEEVSLVPESGGFEHQVPLVYCFSDGTDICYVDNEHDLYSYNIESGITAFITGLGGQIESRGRISSIVRHHDSFFVGFIMDGLLKIEKDGSGYKTLEMPVNSGIFCIRKDSFQDIVWIGTDGQGVVIYSDPMYSIRSVVLNRYEDDIQRPVRALHIDDDRTLWVGTKGNGILKIYDYDIAASPAECRKETLNVSNSGLGSNAVYCFERSMRPLLWIGDEEGLSFFSYPDGKVHKVPVKADGLDFKYIHDIYETRDGTGIWLASVGMGVVRARIGGTASRPVLEDVKLYSINDGDLNSNYFFSIYAENDSTIVFSNKGYGAFRWNPTTDGIEPLTSAKYDNMTLNNIMDIDRDSSGNWLIGTSYGLIKYASETSWSLFNTRNGFPNGTVHAILKSGPDDFWLSTNLGLVNFNSAHDVFRTYGFNDGLDVVEFSDGAEFYDEASGTLYFGGINGFTAVMADGSPETPYMPPVHFDRLTIFGRQHNIGEYLVRRGGKEVLDLDYGQNYFTVSFAAVDHVNGNNITYRYKLKGRGDQWIDNGHDGAVSFTNMSPGEYTLQVKYYNSAFDRESDIYSIVIHVADPWYGTWWAYVIYSVLALLATAGAVHSVIQKNRRKRREMLAELEARHKENVFESKLRFFTDVANEFSTPLTLIYGPCGQILSEKGISRPVSGYARMIQTNARRLDSLIHELIEFRHIETGNREARIEAVDMSSTLNDIASTFEEVAKSRGISFGRAVPSGLEWNTDKGFICTTVTNLISYAFQHTPSGESIFMDVRQDAGTMLYIGITSTGTDIQDEDLHHVFNRYAALDNIGNGEGTDFPRSGLGLAIAHNMVRLLGGTLDARKSDAGGAILDLSLPAAELPAESGRSGWTDTGYVPMLESGPISLPEYEFDKMRPTLLVIDDEAEMLWFIGDIFHDDYNVITLQDASKLGQVMNDVYPNVIICDMTMPHVSGIEITRQIKSAKETAHIPVIIISGKYEMENQMEALSAGAQLYVTKPFSAEFLKVSVAQMMERKKVLKDYFSSPISSFEKSDGKLTHKESRKFLQKVLKVINDNITSRELSPRFIASHLAISTRSFYRRMEEAGGESPTDLIRQCRLHVAKDMLLSTQKTIDEIVFASGFANKVTFFKLFREKYGCTPKEFRTKHLEVVNPRQEAGSKHPG